MSTATQQQPKTAEQILKARKRIRALLKGCIKSLAKSGFSDHEIIEAAGPVLDQELVPILGEVYAEAHKPPKPRIEETVNC
jgi:hypothetical protein